MENFPEPYPNPVKERTSKRRYVVTFFTFLGVVILYMINGSFPMIIVKMSSNNTRIHNGTAEVGILSMNLKIKITLLLIKYISSNICLHTIYRNYFLET